MLKKLKKKFVLLLKKFRVKKNPQKIVLKKFRVETNPPAEQTNNAEILPEKTEGFDFSLSRFFFRFISCPNVII